MASKTQTSTAARSRGKRLDAVARLKADHRQVEAWFSQFSKSKSLQKKRQLAAQICDALMVYKQLLARKQALQSTAAAA
jgi:hemerythrin superfamily protein